MLGVPKNRYGLPETELERIRGRDRLCVYCHKEMVGSGSDGPRSNWATIEHLNHLPPWDNPSSVSICCWSCNSSRGNRILSDWFESEYCRARGINETTVAKPVRDYLREFEGRV